MVHVFGELRGTPALRLQSGVPAFDEEGVHAGLGIGDGGDWDTGLAQNGDALDLGLPGGRVGDGKAGVVAPVSHPKAAHRTLAPVEDFGEARAVTFLSRLNLASRACAFGFVSFHTVTVAQKVAQRQVSSGEARKKANEMMVARVAEWQTRQT